MMRKKNINFAIIGCGVISEWHAKAIEEIEGATLIGVTDVYEPSRIRFAESHNVKAFDSVESLLSDPSIDVVNICTPSGLHAPLAVAAANAGKSIVVEKPMAITAEQIQDILNACDKNNVKLAVISQLRFSDAVCSLKKAVDEGLLGKLVLGDLDMKYYRSQEYYDKSAWRGTWKMEGGGALMNQGIHGIDLLQYIMGPVKSVSAITRTLTRKIEVEDTAVAVLEFQNGALGHITGTTSVYPGSPRTLEICGDRGTISLTEDSISSWNIEGQDVLPDGVSLGGKSGDTSSDPSNFSIAGHIRQISDMADAVRNNRAPMVDQYEGKRPVEIILAIYESSKTGKTIQL
jgi:UDP-N-acetyl-2-amino-2-deoxyglucuronate dehydrogenase